MDNDYCYDIGDDNDNDDDNSRDHNNDDSDGSYYYYDSDDVNDSDYYNYQYYYSDDDGDDDEDPLFSPLLSSPLLFSSLRASKASGVPIKILAVEKNLHAVITLRNRAVTEEWENVQIIQKGK